MTRFAPTLLATALIATTLLAGGCQRTIDSRDLRDNWTPELKSVAMSGEELRNYRSRHRHNTWRQIHDDWAAIWLEDRNIGLTRYTLP